MNPGYLWLLILFVSGCSTEKTSASAQPPLIEENIEYASAFYQSAPSEGDAPGPCESCGPIVLIHADGPGPGPIDDAYVVDLASQLRERYGLNAVTNPTVEVPAHLFDKNRRQYEGISILTHFEAKNVLPTTPDGTTYILLMNEDLHLEFRPDWGWAFGLRRTWTESNGGKALISASRMSGINARRRMLVMLGKYIGGIACGFDTSSDPESIMYDKILSADDLDTMGAVACYRNSPAE